MSAQPREHLPSCQSAHYFTRNRTHGSVFPSVFLRVWEVPTIVPRCFRLLFWQQERIALGRWPGTISHEAGLFGGCRSACVTGRTVSASDLLTSLFASLHRWKSG